MTSRLDVFRVEATGQVLWICSAESLGQAKARIRELAPGEPAEYLIVNHDTGDKLVVAINEAPQTGPSDGKSRSVAGD